MNASVLQPFRSMLVLITTYWHVLSLTLLSDWLCFRLLVSLQLLNNPRATFTCVLWSYISATTSSLPAPS